MKFTKPGRYAVACFVLGGTKTIEAPTEGPPHTDNGMFDEFEVKERQRYEQQVSSREAGGDHVHDVRVELTSRA